MKPHPLLARLSSVIVVAALTGCSTLHRAPTKPSVAIMISIPGGSVPTPAEITSIYKVMQPEIESYGYVMARDPRVADFLVYVRDPIDPRGSMGGRIRFERVDPNQQINAAAAAIRELKLDSARASRDLATEPKE